MVAEHMESDEREQNNESHKDKWPNPASFGGALNSGSEPDHSGAY